MIEWSCRFILFIFEICFVNPKWILEAWFITVVVVVVIALWITLIFGLIGLCSRQRVRVGDLLSGPVGC